MSWASISFFSTGSRLTAQHVAKFFLVTWYVAFLDFNHSNNGGEIRSLLCLTCLFICLFTFHPGNHYTMIMDMSRRRLQ